MAEGGDVNSRPPARRGGTHSTLMRAEAAMTHVDIGLRSLEPVGPTRVRQYMRNPPLTLMVAPVI
jgi:hypothetical protein